MEMRVGSDCPTGKTTYCWRFLAQIGDRYKEPGNGALEKKQQGHKEKRKALLEQLSQQVSGPLCESATT